MEGQFWLIELIKTNGESRKISFMNRFRVNSFGQKGRKECLQDVEGGFFHRKVNDTCLMLGERAIIQL